MRVRTVTAAIFSLALTAIIGVACASAVTTPTPGGSPNGATAAPATSTALSARTATPQPGQNTASKAGPCPKVGSATATATPTGGKKAAALGEVVSLLEGEAAYIDCVNLAVQVASVAPETRQATLVITRDGKDYGRHELIAKEAGKGGDFVTIGGQTVRLLSAMAVRVANNQTKGQVELVVQADQRLIDANTAFGFDLLREMSTEDKGKNVFMSPLSAHVVLSMVANGADGETRVEMARTLHIDGMSEEEANRAVQALLEGLNATGVGKVDSYTAQLMATAVAKGDETAKDPMALYTANSLWANKGVTFNEDFMARNRQYFNAQIETLDFSAQGSLDRVNGWVSKNTNGKIDKILDKFPTNAVLLLLNTLYFKVPWAVQFNEKKTQVQAFHLADGQTAQVSIMHNNWKLKYLKGTDFAAVQLPYEGNRTSMYVFLPDEGVPLDAWVQRLNGESWNTWMTGFKEGGGDVALPKFAFGYESKLNLALQHLGIRLAFSGGFRRMSPSEPSLGEVKQKTVVDVNEKGTEAAAVTSAFMEVSGPAFTFDFVADRPFLFAIRDDDTGALLFLGTVYDPRPAAS